MNQFIRLLIAALFFFGTVPLSYASINFTEVDIYDIESHKGIKGSLDTRMLTKEGRAKIAEDVKKSKVGFYDVAADIMTKDSLTILDAFSHQGNKVDFFDGMQDAIRNDKDLQKQLADPNLTVEDKNKLMTQLATSVAAKLDIKLGDVSTIATDATTNKGEQIKGAYHEASNDIVINDVNTDGTGDAINTLGHEIAHALDSQDGVVRKGTTADGQSYSEEYANTMGESLQDYADFAMWNNTDGQTVANTNNHNGTVVTDAKGNKTAIATTGTATDNFVERNKKDGELDYYLLPNQLADADAASEKCVGSSCQRIKDTAKEISARQDFGLVKAKAACELGNCDDLNRIKLGIKVNSNPEKLVQTIKGLHPDWTQEQVDAKAVEYQVESANSLDESTSRAIFGTLDAVGQMGAGLTAVPSVVTKAGGYFVQMGDKIVKVSQETWEKVRKIEKSAPDVEKVVKRKVLNDKINQRAEQKVFEEEVGFKHKKSISGKKANEKAGKGQKEWNDNDIVKEGTLPKGQKPDTIARAHKNEKNLARPYLGDKSQMKGKNESQLKKEYALPKKGEYKQITDYKGTKDQKVQIGKTGKNDWGPGGNTQVKIKPGQKRLSPREDFYPGSTPVNKP